MEQEAQLLMVGKNDDKGKFMEPAKNENFMTPWKTVRVKESYPSNASRAQIRSVAIFRDLESMEFINIYKESVSIG